MLARVDSEIEGLIMRELHRQQNTLMLIPSENYASPAVLEAQSCVFNNKYAEGYIANRYYQGCRWVDEVEKICIERAKKLFGAEHINVQTHSGTGANIACYQALLQPKDKILSLDLRQGGHLSHGKEGSLPFNFYTIVNYGLSRKTELFDLEEVRRVAKKENPRLIIVGTSSYPRKIEFGPWREIADEVGAYLMADMAHTIGLIAGKVYPDPVPYADVVTATTQKTLRGPRGAFIMCRKEIADRIDRAVFPGTQGGPFIHIIAAKAVCFKEAMDSSFKNYAHQIITNSRFLADGLMEEGFKLVTGGTDTHLILVDLSSKKITGRQAALLLEEAGIVVNKNCIPFDPLPPSITSGIRLGTPALTTRGMRESEMKLIAHWIGQILNNPQKGRIRSKIKLQVEDLCHSFPIYETYPAGYCYNS
ncbi:serine hydroxymethyltransferase [Candidatus Aerophobetes bacterium]|nr:serine hydroxymethyltransferase [Candidatus Aerophobetes bacterium]